EPAGTLHAYLGLSSVAKGKILSMDLSDVEQAPGVVAVLTARDVPGSNDVSPTGLHDEPILPETEIQFLGQPIFAVVAQTREAARHACQKARISYEEEAAL